jgi:RimJ/RimL family protein N-acetyltransferase
VAVIEAKKIVLKNGKEVCLRTPTAEDTKEVLKYLEEIFKDDRFFLTTAEEGKEWQKIETEREFIQKSYANENNLMVISETDGLIVSMANIECSGKIRTRHVGQMGISILPDWRGVGLGTAILRAMIDWAAAYSVIEKLSLGVWAANQPAIGLYKRMGFLEEGRKVREAKFADGSYDDMVCMYRFVR